MLLTRRLGFARQLEQVLLPFLISQKKTLGPKPKGFADRLVKRISVSSLLPSWWLSLPSSSLVHAL